MPTAQGSVETIQFDYDGPVNGDVTIGQLSGKMIVREVILLFNRPAAPGAQTLNVEIGGVVVLNAATQADSGRNTISGSAVQPNGDKIPRVISDPTDVNLTRSANVASVSVSVILVVLPIHDNVHG